MSNAYPKTFVYCDEVVTTVDAVFEGNDTILYGEHADGRSTGPVLVLLDGYGRQVKRDGEHHEITLGVEVILPDGTTTTGDWYTRSAQLRLADGRIAENVTFNTTAFSDSVTVVNFDRYVA